MPSRFEDRRGPRARRPRPRARSAAAPSRRRSPPRRSGGTSARTRGRCSCRRRRPGARARASSASIEVLVRNGTSLHAGQVRDDGAAADVDEDARRRQQLVADADGIVRLEAGVASEHGAACHARAATSRRRARAFAITASARALTALHVDADGAPSSDDAVVGGAAREVRGVGAGDQRLGRHAAGVDAGAAEQMALDERDGHAGRGQPAGERRAGLAGADDDRVEAGSWQRDHDEQGAADRDRVLDEGGRAIAAERLRQPAAEGAPPSVPTTAPTTPATSPGDERCRRPRRSRRRRSAPLTIRAPNCTGTVRLGVDRQLVGRPTRRAPAR